MEFILCRKLKRMQILEDLMMGPWFWSSILWKMDVFEFLLLHEWPSECSLSFPSHLCPFLTSKRPFIGCQKILWHSVKNLHKQLHNRVGACVIVTQPVTRLCSRLCRFRLWHLQLHRQQHNCVKFPSELHNLLHGCVGGCVICRIFKISSNWLISSSNQLHFSWILPKTS